MQKPPSAEDIETSFSFFDSNRDGQFTSNDLQVLLKSFHINLNLQQTQDLINEIDSSGNVNLASFSSFIDSKDKGTNDHDLQGAFDLFDRNKDGKVSVLDLRMVLALLGEKLTEEDSDELIRSLDLNGDGFVDFREFKIAMTRSL